MQLDHAATQIEIPMRLRNQKGGEAQELLTVEVGVKEGQSDEASCALYCYKFGQAILQIKKEGGVNWLSGQDDNIDNEDTYSEFIKDSIPS